MCCHNKVNLSANFVGTQAYNKLQLSLYSWSGKTDNVDVMQKVWNFTTG
jgi:hypothetical protein